MSPTDIELKVRELIIEQSGIPDGVCQNRVVLTDPLFEKKLNLDSLDLVELCMSLEEAFPFFNTGIEADDAEKWRTVGDVVRFVQEKSISENPCPSVAEKSP